MLPLRLNAELAAKDNVDLCLGARVCSSCVLCVRICILRGAVFRVRDTHTVGRFADDVTLGGLLFCVVCVV